jgi:hypothetical protein
VNELGKGFSSLAVGGLIKEMEVMNSLKKEEFVGSLGFKVTFRV